jgi:hypothetical protein
MKRWVSIVQRKMASLSSERLAPKQRSFRRRLKLLRSAATLLAERRLVLTTPKEVMSRLEHSRSQERYANNRATIEPSVETRGTRLQIAKARPVSRVVRLLYKPNAFHFLIACRIRVEQQVRGMLTSLLNSLTTAMTLFWASLDPFLDFTCSLDHLRSYC